MCNRNTTWSRTQGSSGYAPWTNDCDGYVWRSAAQCMFSIFMLLTIFGAFATAQRSQSSTPSELAERRHQRWLPLPVTGNEAMAEFERQLRNPSSVRAERNRSNPTDTPFPKLDKNDIQQLKDLIKQYSDQMPLDFEPPNMDGISSDAITRALQDPEVLEKARKLVEQYQRNQQTQRRPRSRPDQPKAANPQDGQREEPDEPSVSGLPQSNHDNDRARSQSQNNSNANSPQPRDQTNRPQNKPDASDTTAPTRDVDAALSAEDALFNFSETPTRTSSENGTAPQREMMRNVEDLLKQINQSEAKRWANDAKSSSGNSNRGQADSSSGSNGISSHNEDIRRQLEQKGFGQTLRNLVEEARKSAEKQSQSRTDDPPRDLQARNSRDAANANSSQPSSNANNATKNAVEGSKNSNGSNEWSRWLSNALQDLNESVSKNTPSNNVSSNDTGSAASKDWSQPPSMPSVPEFLNGWTLLALGSLLALLIVMFYSKRIKERVIIVLESQKSQSDLLRAPDLIQTRADVIRAFHQLAHRVAAPVEDWWTHRNIMRHASRKSPLVRPPLEVAAEIYELARYQPTNVELSPEQLELVRKAMQDCEAKRKG